MNLATVALKLIHNVLLGDPLQPSLNFSKHFYTIFDFLPSDDLDVGSLLGMLTSGLISCSELH